MLRSSLMKKWNRGKRFTISIIYNMKHMSNQENQDLI